MNVMSLLGKYSLGTHLLIATGLLIAVGAFVVASNWTTFALMYDNLAAMNEGKQVAEQMRHPEDLLSYIADRPEQASLVAYDVGAREEGLFYRAEKRRPVVHLPHLLLLAEYARQVEANQLDPERQVSLDSMALYALPGAGRGSHEQARAHWRMESLFRADSAVALRHVIDALPRFGDEAAADWLITAFGREQVQALPDRWDLRASDPPLPSSGVHLSWSHLPEDDAPAQRGRIERDAYTDQVYHLVQTLRRDTSFRRREHQQLRQRGTGLSIRDQRARVQQTYPEGTAADYADLFARIADGTLGAPPVAQILQDHLESPIEGDSIEAPIRALSTTVGATPGVISFVGYARSAKNRPPRVAALLLEDLPIGLFYHLVQTDLDKGFQLRLLSDPEFFKRVRETLSEKPSAASIIR